MASFIPDSPTTPTPPTPADITNDYPRSSLQYRVGRASSFLASMQMAAAARARVAPRIDDPRHALFDAWGSALDVLTFYSERIANENYLRTATELGSLIALARQVSEYRGKGSAASTVLAFTLDTSAQTAIIPQGTQVMSVPGADEKPQVFETEAALGARAEFNSLQPSPNRRQEVDPRAQTLALAGSARVAVGDLVLIWSPGQGGQGLPAWGLRTVQAVTPVPSAGKTTVELAPEGVYGDATPMPDQTPHEAGVFVFRQRATLFGASAPIARDAAGNSLWPFHQTPEAPIGTLDLDAVYPGVLPGSWVAITSPGTTTRLQAVREVGVVFRDGSVTLPTTVRTPTGNAATQAAVVDSHITFSGRVSRLGMDTTLTAGPEEFWRESTVLVQTEALPLLDTIIGTPVSGTSIDLPVSLAPAFGGARTVIVTGRAPAARVPDHVTGLVIYPGGQDSEGVALPPGSLLTILSPPQPNPESEGSLLWKVAFDNRTGMVPQDAIVFVDAPDTAPRQAESRLARAIDAPPSLALDRALDNAYDRASCRVLANAVSATHGESIGTVAPGDLVRREILGSGDATPCQQFKLSKPNLTYVGTRSTLAVQVNGVEWQEQPNLAHSGPDDRHFFVRVDDKGFSTLIFGDGVTGARLPTGHENITASYRSGIGTPGNLKAGQLTQLLTRPFGVKGVTNPIAPVGGVDPDPPETFRANAGSHLRRGTRVVSVGDYEDTARTWQGIAKALAVPVHLGGRSIIHLTLAGAAGTSPRATADIESPNGLLATLARLGNPHQAVAWAEAEAVSFEATLRIYAAASFPEAVALAVKNALLVAFGFDNRDLAQPVLASELIAVAQAVPNVAGVAASLADIPARTTTVAEGVILPAQLVTVDPAHLIVTGVPG